MSATDLAAIITVSIAYVIGLFVFGAMAGRSIRRLDRAVRQFHDAVEDLHRAIDRVSFEQVGEEPSTDPVS